MLQYEECSKKGYAARTEQNIIESELTIALAVDPFSAGEICTRKLCDKHGKPYVMVKMGENLGLSEVIAKLDSIKPKFINIAGNGIKTLKQPQDKVDHFVWKFLCLLKKTGHLDSVTRIQSGGQTGIDEAAIKAGIRLGFRTKIVAPMGWMLRTSNGFDLSNELAFKGRFVGIKEGE